MNTPTALATALGVHPLIGEVLWARGCRDVDAARAFLDPAFYTPTPPERMPGMAQLVTRLRAAIETKELIRIWGDFDVDGQTSTSVLLLGLHSLGARVDFTIPDRAVDSHGLNIAGLRQAACACCSRAIAASPISTQSNLPPRSASTSSSVIITIRNTTRPAHFACRRRVQW